MRILVRVRNLYGQVIVQGYKEKREKKMEVVQLRKPMDKNIKW